MKYLAFFLIFLPAIANAATVEDPTFEHGFWIYKYIVKSSAVSLPMEAGTTFVYKCDKHTDELKAKELPYRCVDTEAEARKIAQADADKYEQKLKDLGFSTTVIETKRRLGLIKN